jgi:nitroreductase
MNPTCETILNRRSIRLYEPKQISRGDLETILSCGDAGPSGANNRGWRYVVVQDPSFKKKLVEKGMPLYQKWLEKMPQRFKDMRTEIDKGADPIYYGAPTIVFVAGRGLTVDFDCAIVCQNIMLAARSMGIGSCWVHIGQLVLEDPSVRAEFQLAENEKVYGPVILGYPLRNEFPPRLGNPPSPVLWK